MTPWLVHRTVESPNWDERALPITMVVLHYTGMETAEAALERLCDPEAQVSAHYCIEEDGTVHRLVREDRRAWHAGASYWGGTTDINSASIGIELDNSGDEPFATAQIDALLDLLAGLVERHQIPSSNIIGHGDIAPGRKVDPSHHFPWQRLAERGFGRWCEPAADQPLPALDGPLALRALGYEVSNLPAAIAAFRRHFLGDDGIELGEDGLRRLDCLLKTP